MCLKSTRFMVLREEMKKKFQVSKYRLRWNAENVMSSIMSPPRKITQLPILRAL